MIRRVRIIQHKCGGTCEASCTHDLIIWSLSRAVRSIIGEISNNNFYRLTKTDRSISNLYLSSSLYIPVLHSTTPDSHSQMPFTPAFVDTGKPVPTRYDISTLKIVEEKERLRHSRNTLKALVAKEHRHRASRKNKRLSKFHKQQEWNFQRLKQLIADRLLARVKRPEQTMREAYKLFGVSKGGGVKKHRFSKALYNMGLDLTPEEIDDLFAKFDVDGSGFLDFEELVDHCMPKDYTRKTWVTKRDEQQTRDRHGVGKQNVAPDEPNFPASMQNFRWSVEEMERMLREKLIARCKRPEEQFQTAFLLFGRPKFGITLKVFIRVLRKIGMSLTEPEATLLLNKYDVDGSGQLDFVEFTNGVMGVDYSRKLWNEKRGEAIQKEAAAKRLRVNVSVIEEHHALTEKFRKDQVQKKAMQQKRKEHALQKERAAILKRHQRLAKRREKQQRGYGHSNRARTQSASRRRRGTTEMQTGYGSILYQHTMDMLPAGHTTLETPQTKQSQSSREQRPSTAGLKRGTSLNPNSPSQRRLYGALQHSQSQGLQKMRRRPRTAGGIGHLIRSSKKSTMKSKQQTTTHDFGWK